MLFTRRLLACALLTAAVACAHGPQSSGAEGLRKTADLFHHRARWKDYGGAALIVVPEKRADFERGRRELNDERDLTISDYELTELTLSADGLEARVTSHINWYRLPSVSQHDDNVVSLFVWRDGQWLLAQQMGGPFDGELATPYTPPAPDAGTH